MAPARTHTPERTYLATLGPDDPMPVRLTVRDGRIAEAHAVVMEYLKADWSELRAALIASGRVIMEV